MVNLAKGGRINLSKTDPGLTQVRVGLSWKPNTFSSGSKYDLDATAFVLQQDASGKSVALGDSYIIFYNQPTSPEGAVKHSGDNRTGEGEGDDESIIVDLSVMPAAADEISFIVTIDEAIARKQNFGQVAGSKITIYNDATGEAIASYDLEENFSSETAVQFGSLYKKDGQWSFKAVGMGYNAGLADFCRGYGLEVA